MTEFDYLVVGAGPAGCVLANRLSADPTSSICLLEAGPPDKNIMLRVPAGVYSASSNPRFAWQYGTEPSEGTWGRSIPMPQGRTLGGSTAINGMNYNRGSKEDFDGWAKRGNQGWSYEDVLPYFKRSERRVGVCDLRYRGLEGPLPITDSDWRHPVCDAFIQAAESLGLPRNSDYNAASQSGVGYYQRYIEKGWRISAATAFLRPIRRRSNLDVRTSAEVVSLILDGRRAVGVRYTRGPGSPVQELRARREVILAAGAANTPKLLQLSGIGHQSHLSSIGIPVLQHLPGVGENLQDHYMVHLVVSLRGSRGISGRGLGLLREGANWAIGRPSILAISPSLVFGFVNSETVTGSPDIQIDVALGNYSRRATERVPVVKIGFYQLRPMSRGHVRARSADPCMPPVIQPNYLKEPADQRSVLRGVRTIRKIVAEAPFKSFYDAEELPGSVLKSDSDLLDFARQVGLTAYHLCGTCQMGSRPETGAVVDQSLRVHGIDRLRIADASVMPSVVSANTSAAVFMIGEKAADLVRETGKTDGSVFALAG